MKNIFLFVLIMTTSFLYSKDSISLKNEKQRNDIIQNKNSINELSNKFQNIKDDFENQEKLNIKIFDGINSQISATSYNLTVFGILFAIAALGLGAYVTYIERKVVRIKEENQELLVEAKSIKKEILDVNENIQKDIYSLFLKIKRQETVHILDRLIKIPEDISNLSQSLLSRELEKEDYLVLKEAYLKLKNKTLKIEEDENQEEDIFDLALDYKASYKLLFFQHFLDLSIKDDLISNDLIDYYDSAVGSAFENDILKSTKDFMTSIMEVGFKTKTKEINAYMKALSLSNFQCSDDLYELIMSSLKTRENQFTFLELLKDEKELRIGKFKIGQILIVKYSSLELSESEIRIINYTKEIGLELDSEAKEAQLEKEKRKELFAQRRKEREERKKNQMP